MIEPDGPTRFTCTEAGVVAKGQRRLTLLLLGLCLTMLITTIAVWFSGRIFPGILALVMAFVSFTAWRMSRELALQWLELGDGVLTLRAIHQQIQLSASDLQSRRLDSTEIEHLERLASAGGIVAGSGGFDSHLLGEFELYATDLRNSVLIESPESRFVVTPDEPDAFLAALEDESSTPQGGDGPATILGS